MPFRVEPNNISLRQMINVDRRTTGTGLRDNSSFGTAPEQMTASTAERAAFSSHSRIILMRLGQDLSASWTILPTTAASIRWVSPYAERES